MYMSVTLFKKIGLSNFGFFVLVIVLVTIIFYVLFFKENREGFYPFTSSDPAEAEFNSVKSYILSKSVAAPTIVNVPANRANTPIGQFFVMGSYNSAITGNYVYPEMITFILGRGCRYLDFEILLIKDAPQVAYTTDKTYDTIDTYNYASLANIFRKIAANAFSTVSNKDDPVFINLRIKSKNHGDKTSHPIYPKVAAEIHQFFGKTGLLFSGKVNSLTPIGNLKGKIVIIMDKSINPNYEFESLSPAEQAALLAKNNVKTADDLPPEVMNPYTNPRRNYETQLFGKAITDFGESAEAKAAAAAKARAEEEKKREAAAAAAGGSGQAYYHITDFINIESASFQLYQHEYSELMATKPIEMNPSDKLCSGCDDLKHMRVIVPDMADLYKDSINKPFQPLLKNWGCQFVPFMFYANNFNELNRYESFFSREKTAFIFRRDALRQLKDAEYPSI
jgi:hypothetical protein